MNLNAAPLLHRTDIEGLRGVAVLAVMGVHAWPELLRGGFVGVDIFFVLSGYLIATLQFRQPERSGVDVLAFYARRARRLLPALCTVLAACLTAALWTFPSEARQIGLHVASGAAFVANLVLWREAGYFDAASESKPLLHLWSLGIEEQFYLLWPALAWVVLRRPRVAGRTIGALLLASFLLNVLFVESRSKGTFFLLPTRAWELLLGVALAWAQAGGWQLVHAVPQRWRAAAPDMASWLGAALIGLAFAALDKARLFPGWWALLPTVGTLLLLAAGPDAWFNRRVLSHRTLVFYGVISYPLYLWHWPLLVFPQLHGIALDDAGRVLIVTASVALAALTTEFVERPLRFGRLAADPRVPLRLGAALALTGAVGLALHRSDGLLHRYPKEVQEVARAEFGFDFGAYRAGRCFLDLVQGPDRFAAECDGGPTGARVLLWGDSHAASLYPGLMAAAQARSMSIAQYTKARCPPLLAAPAAASAGCEATTQHVLAQVTASPPEVAILAGFWSFYELEGGRVLDARALRATVTALRERGVRRVVVVGHLPTWTDALPRVLLTEWRRRGAVPERSAAGVDPRAIATDRRLAEAVVDMDVRFFSPIAALCDAGGCRVAVFDRGVALPLAHDESHLTEVGARLLVATGVDAWWP